MNRGALRLLALASALVGSRAAAQDAGPRIAGITATLEPENIEAAAHVTGSPARVLVEIVPAGVTPLPRSTRVEATRRAVRPEAIAAYGPNVTLWTARLPAPGRFGAFRGRFVALDAAGTEIARSEADWARSFAARIEVTAVTPALDVSTGPGEGIVRIDVASSIAVAAIAVQTDAHVSAELGFGSLPYEAAQDERLHGRTFPPITVRIARVGPSSFEVRFAVPADFPSRALSVDRVYVRSVRGHVAEDNVQSDRGVVQVTSASPRPAALDVGVQRERGDLVVALRIQGPVLGRARTLFGLPVPNVEARIRDRLRLVRGRCVPDEAPMRDPPWDGSSMTCRLRTTTRDRHPLLAGARLSIVAGSHTIGEAPLEELLRP